jgi:small subunit ribosomal protein S16
MYRQHLNKGVAKGALTQEKADEKFNTWLEQKNLKISQKVQDVMNKKKDEVKSRASEEEVVKQKIAEKVAAKKVAAMEAEAAAKAAAVEAPAEAPAEGEAPAENSENTEAAS